MAEVSIANGVYEVRVHGRMEEQEYINVIHFQATADNRDLLVDLLIKLWVCLVTNLIPKMSSKFRLERLTVKRVAPTLGPEWEYAGEGSEGLQGASESGSLPSFASVRCNIRCERGGRSGSGAIAFSGIPEDATDGSTILDSSEFWAGLVAWLACVAALFLKGSGFGTKFFHIGVVSRKLGEPKPPYNVDQFSPAVSMKFKGLMGTQNSRKVGKGS